MVCAPEVPATLPLGKGAGDQLVAAAAAETEEEGAEAAKAGAEAPATAARGATKAPLASAAAEAEGTSTPSTVTTAFEVDRIPSLATTLDSTAPGCVLTRAARLAAERAAPPTPAEPWSCGGNETATSNERLLPLPPASALSPLLEASATETGEGAAAALRDSVMSLAISASACTERGGAPTAAGEAGSVERVTVKRSVATTGAERAPTSAAAASRGAAAAAAEAEGACCCLATEATSRDNAVTLASAMATLAAAEEEEEAEESDRLRRLRRLRRRKGEGLSSVVAASAELEVISTEEKSPLKAKVSPSKSCSKGAEAAEEEAEAAATFLAKDASGAAGSAPSAVDARCSATLTADGETNFAIDPAYSAISA